MRAKHIDEAQPSDLEEHFRALIEDEETIDCETSEELKPTDLPEWYDENLFRAGQRYYTSNVLGLTTAGLAGLITVLAVPSILNILIHTKQSGTPCTAFKRYLETILHTRVWYMTDVKDVNSDWYKTTNTVRWKHCTANRRSLRDGIGGITHRDLALTQFGFIGYILLKPEYLGLTNTAKEREGLNHLWRVLGHLLGIPDRLNICRKTEAETTELCKKLSDQVFDKYLREISPNFLEMTRALLEGLWSVDVTTDTDTIMAFAYKLNNVPFYKPLGLYSSMNLKYRETLHKLCGTPYVGTIMRVLSNYLMTFNTWIAKNLPVVAWLQWGREQSRIRMYPNLK